MVDLPALKAYAALKIDRRQEMLELYIKQMEEHGATVAGRENLCALSKRYWRKCIAGVFTGRLYGPRLSLQGLTREARAAACSSFAKDLDMDNAYFALLQLLDDGTLINLYKLHAQTFRTAISLYYDVPVADAKIILLKALFGFALRVPGREAYGVLPFIQVLAKECVSAKVRLASSRPSLVNFFKEGGRRDPEASAFAYVLMDAEHAVLSKLMDSLSQHNLRLVAPIFDGAIVCNADFGGGSMPLRSVTDAIETSHQIIVREKEWPKQEGRGVKRVKREIGE